MLENFISVINYLYSRKSNSRAKALPTSHFHIMYRIWSSIYRQKLLLAHGVGGMILNKMFSDSHTF